MKTPTEIRKIMEEHTFLAREFFERSADDVAKAADRLVRALREGRKVLFFGNGGSAADSQHLAAELTGRFRMERNPLPALALTTNTSSLTAIGNDYDFDQVFARQIQALGVKGDVAIAISTSGQSRNILEAIRVASEQGLETIGLLGREGGPAREMVDIPLVVGAQKTERIQEIHIMIGHILCEIVEEELFGS